MKINLPTMFCYDFINLKSKIDFLKSVKMEFIYLENTKRLIMSLDLMYARYEFYKTEENKIMDRSNSSVMFQSSKQFEKKYKISKNELLERYPYKKSF